jgi:FAD:protein FMN transferase
MQDFDKNLVRVAREAMRTRFEIALMGASHSVEYRRLAGEEALQTIAEIEAWMSAYKDESLLRQVNIHAAYEPMQVDYAFFRFQETAMALNIGTEGAFDMTIGPLLRLWGLGGGAMEGQIPTPEEISEALSTVGMARLVRLDAETRTVAFAVPGVWLDPGAIGKGYALDQAAERLREAEITQALLHGGTSTVLGMGGPFSIALQHPTDRDQLLATILLTDNALSVSAVHGKTFYAAGRRFGHILNPQTGYPIERTLLAAVTHPSATVTDALSTALLVHGSAGMPVLGDSYPEAGFMVVEMESNERGPLQVTTGGQAATSFRCLSQ